MLEMFLSCMWMVFGVGYYAYTIGNMTEMITNHDIENNEVIDKVASMKDYAEYNNIP